ncbi:hypothetical protein [Arcobacter vandammei]|uniref:hypothetical protein n=1 Tax=Arcobacter vandammei TaxID=2782243 RepID=UPI0018DF8432|nr:hypothetical protein [Arcobacter vandammei]
MKVLMSLHEWKESLKESILKQNSSLKSFEKVEDLLMKAIKLQRKRKLREGIKTVIFSKEILKNSNYNKYEKVIKDIKNSFENGTFNNIFNRLSKHHKQNEFYNDSMLDI